MKRQRNRARHSSGLIVAIVGLISAATLMPGPVRIASAQTVYPSWRYTGNLNTSRRFHTATLLENGKVLVAGGFNNCSTVGCLHLNSAELYDPATGIWSQTGNLNRARESHTGTLLPNGKVLVVGGQGTSGNSAELYDPATGSWSSTGNLSTARAGHTATLLPNGKVLVAGSFSCLNCLNLASAEIYDPSTGMWSSTGNLNTGRAGQTATLLPIGKVLVAGGFSIPECPDRCYVLNDAELYDPTTGTWSSTGNLNTGRAGQTATLLANGKLLVVGGLDGSFIPGLTASAELYDPSAGTWSRTGDLSGTLFHHTATLLLNGRVLVVGGVTRNLNPISFAEVFDPATGTWNITAYLNTNRWRHSATLLPNGKVLVAGGTDGNLNSAELYDPSSSPNINIIDDAQFFVQQHYYDFLHREPDNAGLDYWKDQINSCGNDQQCIEIKRINVSAAFFLSIEFQETGYFVYRVNKAAHGNLPGAPIPITLNEFQQQMQEVGQGVVVGAPGWQQLLESNKQNFVGENDSEFDRFTSAYPSSMTPAVFVDTLFANAGVTPSSSERSSVINEFGSASTTEDLPARARALRRVADNSTLKEQEFNRAFVLMQYFGYMRRNPNDSPEPSLNFDGYDFWLNKLNQFNGNFINAEMVRAFLISTEYRQRFGQP